MMIYRNITPSQLAMLIEQARSRDSKWVRLVKKMFVYKWLFKYSDWIGDIGRSLPEDVDRTMITNTLRQFTPDVELAYSVLAWMIMERIEPWNYWNLYQIRFTYSNRNRSYTAIVALSEKAETLVFPVHMEDELTINVVSKTPICNVNDLSQVLASMIKYVLPAPPKNPLSSEEYLLYVEENILGDARGYVKDMWIDLSRKMFETGADLRALARRFNHSNLAQDVLNVVFLYKDTVATNMLLKEFPNRQCKSSSMNIFGRPSFTDINISTHL